MGRLNGRCPRDFRFCASPSLSCSPRSLLASLCRQVLALNCLTSAYMLSALYLKGVKQGDGQMTVLGLVVSAFFYCASRSTPLRRLSAERPPARIFCAQACLSVLGQFSAHLFAPSAPSHVTAFPSAPPPPRPSPPPRQRDGLLSTIVGSLPQTRRQ